MEKIFVEIEHQYAINQDGIVFDTKHERIVTPKRDGSGRSFVILHGWNKQFVDELMLRAFRPDYKKNAPIEHLNGNVSDCSLVNLNAPNASPNLKKMIRCTCLRDNSPRVIYTKGKSNAAHATGCKTTMIDKALAKGETLKSAKGKEWRFEWVVFRCNIDGEIRINDFDDDELCL